MLSIVIILNNTVLQISVSEEQILMVPTTHTSHYVV